MLQVRKPSTRKLKRIGWPIAGAAYGMLIGLLGVTVNSKGIRVEINDNNFTKNETCTIEVFGVPVHEETFSHDEQTLARGTGGWHASVVVWAIGLTALFSVVGATVGVGFTALKSRTLIYS